jgi:ribosome-binding factor A
MTIIRQRRIASELFRVLNDILLEEDFLQDTFPNLLILEVQMVDGLKEAKILFTTHDGNQKHYIQELIRLTSYFHAILRSYINIKKLPILSFVYKNQPLLNLSDYGDR